MRLSVFSIIFLGSILCCSTGLRAGDELTSGLFKASDVIGMNVKNAQDENLGKVEEIVLDAAQGRVAYAVLSFGGFLGMGDKLYAIPWSSLRQNAERKHFILDVDKERLKSAPGFDKDKWPNMADTQWGKNIHDFYKQNRVRNDEGSATRAIDPGTTFAGETKRESTQIPLALHVGETYRFQMQSYTNLTGASARDKDKERDSPGPSGTPPKAPGEKSSTDPNSMGSALGTKELTLLVEKDTGTEKIIRVSTSGDETSNSSCTMRVDNTGRVVSVDETATGTGKSDKGAVEGAPRTPGSQSESKEHLKTCVQNVLGYGLHEGKLEPGATYSMWSFHGSDGLCDKPTMEAGDKAKLAGSGNCKLRYEGIKEINGQRSAIFALVGTATRAGETSQPGTDGKTPPSGTGSGDLGHVAYRIDDGLLEAVVSSAQTDKSSFVIRRVSSERSTDGKRAGASK